MAQPAQSLIHLEGVTKVFYTDEVETRALEDIALDIFKGEYIAIEGPSGCGKSTLLLDPRLRSEFVGIPQTLSIRSVDHRIL